MSWLEELYTEENESVVIRKIRDKMEWLAFSDDRNALNKILDTIDVEQLQPSALIATLKTIKSIRHRLTSYPTFYNLVAPMIVEKMGEYMKEELENYKPV